MLEYSLSHLSDAVLLRDLATLLARDRETTANLLAHIAEVDARRLYAPAGYPSMFAYCVEELHLSEDEAYRRIRAARAARQFPVLFNALAEGRLHLTAISLLAPHITSENSEELIGAASHRRKSAVEALLARLSPVPEPRAVVKAVAVVPTTYDGQLVPGRVGGVCSQRITTDLDELDFGPVGTEAKGDQPAQGRTESESEAGTTNVDEIARGRTGSESEGGTTNVDELAQARVDSRRDHAAPAQTPELRSPVAPELAERFLLKLTISKSTLEKLRHAQALLSHTVPTGDIARLLDRALDALITQCEKRKLGAADTRRHGAALPRCAAATTSGDSRQNYASLGRHAEPNRRYIPARIRRAVWQRDEGRCTFVSARGKRCRSRVFLEFDHVVPARGGTATVEGLRLRCRSHNQYAAELSFGVAFMRRKRDEARELLVQSRTRAERNLPHGSS